MEGYFWRIADARTAIVAFTGISRDATGASWGTIGLAAHPGGFVRTAVVGEARADPRRLDLRVGAQLRADEHGLDVDLGPGARLQARFADVAAWPRRALGGLGLGQLVPGLGQYWHPHMLGGEVTGTAELGDRRVDLGGMRAYGEKNWTPYDRGFPALWWWGQAFPDGEDACVAFAGGRLLGMGAGAVAVRVGAELMHATGPPGPLRMQLGDGTWRLQARTARDVITVHGASDGPPHRLPVPVPRERRALQDVSAMHLAGRVRVTVRRGRRLRYDGLSTLAGLERGGAG
jgi:hypothetical protein